MGLELAEIRAGPSAARLPGPGRAAGRSGDAGDVPANRVRGEARWLGMWLEKAAVGEAFLLQGGDCTESFKEFNANNIRDTFRVFLQMAITLIYGDQMPVIKNTRPTRAYLQSVGILNLLLRAFATGRYAAMQRISDWNLDFIEHSEQGNRCVSASNHILTFM
ncbi:hypothetical protein ACFX13_032764 [Malus domestica]